QLSRPQIELVEAVVRPGVSNEWDAVGHLFVLVDLVTGEVCRLHLVQERPDARALATRARLGHAQDLAFGLREDLLHELAEGGAGVVLAQESGDGRRGDRRPSQRPPQRTKAGDGVPWLG